MKRFEKVIVCILLTVMLVTVLNDTGISLGLPEGLNKSVEAAPSDEVIKEPETLTESEFVVLEIVPNKKNAEFGWLVGGSEPKAIDEISIHEAQSKYAEFLYIENTETEGEIQQQIKNRELFKRYALGLQYVDNNPDNDEEIEGYAFKGWYNEKECKNRYDFSQPITEDKVLYAKWISNREPGYNKKDDTNGAGGKTNGETEDSPAGTPEYSTETHAVCFDVNKPASAYFEVENIPETVKVTDGETVDEPEQPKLRGNIDYKLENNKVRVVSVTPDELKKNEGIEWIERADLIVISDKAGCGFNSGTKKFTNKDIDFNTAYRLLQKVNISDTSCPIIFTQSVYDNALNDSSANTATIKQSPYGNYYTIWDRKGSNNNMYKLFIMQRMMSPTAIYSAYLNTGEIDINTGEYGRQKQYSRSYGYWNGNIEKNAIYWNKCTLLPDGLVSEGNYNSATELKKYNIYRDITDGEGIRFNSYVCNDNNGLTAGFATQKDNYSNKRTTAEAIYELLHDEDIVVSAEDISVLELQPCKDYIKGSFWYWFMHGQMEGLLGGVNVKQISSSEFVGSIEDLVSVYSLIYIGINNNGLLDIHKPNGYPNMVYSHLGKSVNGDSNLRGTLAGDNDYFDTYYYSGNDITLVKRNEMLEFAASGKPLVFAEGALRRNDQKFAVDTGKIDMASNLYELGTIALESPEYTCFSMQEIYDNESFKRIMSNQRMTLQLIKAPVEYRDKTSAKYSTLGLLDRDIYINGIDKSNKNLVYKFTLNAKEDDSILYEVRLYVDTNADGRFDSIEEKLDSLEIYDETTRRNVRPNRLLAGHTYTLTRAADEYLGIMPWKLEVVQVSNNKIRDMAMGMTAIKADNDSEGNVIREELKVLQIVPTQVDQFTAQVYLPTNEEINAAKAKPGNTDYTDFRGVIRSVNDGSDVGNSIADVTGKFWHYTKDLEDFKVTFDRIPVTSRNGVKGLDTAIHENPNFFDDYNMLILGFQDCYSDITDMSTLTAIEDFIYEGKSVLFTHDTTSYINVSRYNFNRNGQGKTYWGYNINQYFRELLGLDRFGVTLSRGVPYYSPLSDTERETLALKDKAYAVNTRQNQENIYSDYRNGIVRNLIQGFSNATLAYAEERTRKVTVTNRGQITEYPYYISDEFNVAETHGQYYQLDLEADDVVVWYTLTGNEGTNYYKSANDVRNNFYIYNKANITYSGVGHSGGLSDEEIKLFINTMIAAYTAAASASKPVITNRDKSSDNNNNDYLYVDYMANDAVNAIGNDILVNESGAKVKRTYFKLRNNSIVSNKQMTLFIYPAELSYQDNPNGSRNIQINGNLSNNLALDIYDAETGVKTAKRTVGFNRTDTGAWVTYTGSIVESGYEYYVDIPIDSMREKDNMAVEMQVVMKFGKNRDKTLIGNRGVVFVRRGMFNID